MRVWDVSPGYLSRQRLLGEHRELHGLHNIISKHKRGYSRHPETVRWVESLSGLAWRHAHLAAEMRLRGYVDRTPLVAPPLATWPEVFITEPADQFALLWRKYDGSESGRIALPRNASELWAQHKYSVMARDPQACRRFGRAVARMTKRQSVDDVVRELTLLLRQPPSRARLVNALEHMWGHVSKLATPAEARAARAGSAELLSWTQSLARRHGERVLLASTALGELGAYVNDANANDSNVRTARTARTIRTIRTITSPSAPRTRR